MNFSRNENQLANVKKLEQEIQSRQSAIKEGEVIHVIVKRCYDLSGLLSSLNYTEANGSEDQSSNDTISTAPGVSKTMQSSQGTIFHGGRNFH